MKELGLLNNVLVWIRDNTRIIELMGGKPDAKAIILYKENENGILIDEIRIKNLGNEKLYIRVVEVNIYENQSDLSPINTIKIFPANIPNITEIDAHEIETDSKPYCIRFDDIEILNSQIGEIYIWMNTDSIRDGSIRYQITGNLNE
jgi:hypothetical protein